MWVFGAVATGSFLLLFKMPERKEWSKGCGPGFVPKFFFSTLPRSAGTCRWRARSTVPLVFSSRLLSMMKSVRSTFGCRVQDWTAISPRLSSMCGGTVTLPTWFCRKCTCRGPTSWTSLFWKVCSSTTSSVTSAKYFANSSSAPPGGSVLYGSMLNATRVSEYGSVITVMASCWPEALIIAPQQMGKAELEYRGGTGGAA
mmetsp:Transcript_54956/g.154601  ORF Transcript_54956/g.154601 Transcript_54956/m.154601 type:complete len:200 (-) Transcript_54956:3-602(-)